MSGWNLETGPTVAKSCSSVAEEEGGFPYPDVGRSRHSILAVHVAESKEKAEEYVWRT